MERKMNKFGILVVLSLVILIVSSYVSAICVYKEVGVTVCYPGEHTSLESACSEAQSSRGGGSVDCSSPLEVCIYDEHRSPDTPEVGHVTLTRTDFWCCQDCEIPDHPEVSLGGACVSENYDEQGAGDRKSECCAANEMPCKGELFKLPTHTYPRKQACECLIGGCCDDDRDGWATDPKNCPKGVSKKVPGSSRIVYGVLPYGRCKTCDSDFNEICDCPNAARSLDAFKTYGKGAYDECLACQEVNGKAETLTSCGGIVATSDADIPRCSNSIILYTEGCVERWKRTKRGVWNLGGKERKPIPIDCSKKNKVCEGDDGKAMCVDSGSSTGKRKGASVYMAREPWTGREGIAYELSPNNYIFNTDITYTIKYDGALFTEEDDLVVLIYHSSEIKRDCEYGVLRQISETITSSGGVIELGDARFDIPAGAVSEAVEFTIKEVNLNNCNILQDPEGDYRKTMLMNIDSYKKGEISSEAAIAKIIEWDMHSLPL